MLTARALSQKGRPLSARDRATLVLAEVDELAISGSVDTQLVGAKHPLSAQALVDLLQRDACAFASLRRFVSHANGAAAQARSPAELIARMGVAVARDALLALHFRLICTLPVKESHAHEVFSQLWQHSVAVACVCRMLCEEDASLGDATTAFSGGLYHDVGKLALIACYPKGYARVVRRAGQDQVPMCEAERDAFGIDHAAIGAHVGLRIPLAKPVIAAIRQHHHPLVGTPEDESCALSAVVQVADQIAHAAGVEGTADQSTCDADEFATVLGVRPDVLVSVAERLGNELLPFTAMITAEMPKPQSSDRNRYGVRIPSSQVTDQDSAAVVASVRRFVGLIDSGVQSVTLRRVCEAAASCVRDVLHVEACMTVLGSADGNVLFLGATSSEAEAVPRSHVVQWPKSSLWDDISTRSSASGSRRAGDAFGALWERCFQTVPRESLRALPIDFGTCVGGAIVVPAGARDEKPLPEGASGLDALVAVIGLAATVASCGDEHALQADRPPDDVRYQADMPDDAARDETISTIAAMAAGAAHELNNPLSVISGRAQILLGDCDDDTLAKALREITDQAHRASQIVTDLMNYARPDPPRPASFTLKDFLSSLSQHWQASFGHGLERLVLGSVDGELTVFADSKQVAQILEAVITNAVLATEKGSASVHINSPSVASDEMVRIVVTDDGVGMTREVLAHAFDPFFSFRPAGRGRGLGLSRACRLAEVNGGRLRLESKVGSGTTVTIELPAR